jgi:hypothetical protein
MATIKRNCEYCGVEYDADTRNLKRGWGLTCSKSCAAKKRAQDKLVVKPAAKAKSGITWNETAKSLPIRGTSVLGYKKSWHDDKCNPAGIRYCFYDWDGDFVVSVWDAAREIYDYEYDEPTHWISVSELPKP